MIEDYNDFELKLFREIGVDEHMFNLTPPKVWEYAAEMMFINGDVNSLEARMVRLALALNLKRGMFRDPTTMNQMQNIYRTGNIKAWDEAMEIATT